MFVAEGLINPFCPAQNKCSGWISIVIVCQQCNYLMTSGTGEQSRMRMRWQANWSPKIFSPALFDENGIFTGISISHVIILTKEPGASSSWTFAAAVIVCTYPVRLNENNRSLGCFSRHFRGILSRHDQNNESTSFTIVGNELIGADDISGCRLSSVRFSAANRRLTQLPAKPEI